MNTVESSRSATVPVNHEVVNVEYSGEEDVYCGSVEETHRFFIVTEHDDLDPRGGDPEWRTAASNIWVRTMPATSDR